jgi:hypothetical protein
MGEPSAYLCYGGTDVTATEHRSLPPDHVGCAGRRSAPSVQWASD